LKGKKIDNVTDVRTLYNGIIIKTWVFNNQHQIKRSIAKEVSQTGRRKSKSFKKWIKLGLHLHLHKIPK
jgi:hypothetical protein